MLAFLTCPGRGQSFTKDPIKLGGRKELVLPLVMTCGRHLHLGGDEVDFSACVEGAFVLRRLNRTRMAPKIKKIRGRGGTNSREAESNETSGIRIDRANSSNPRWAASGTFFRC